MRRRQNPTGAEEGGMKTTLRSDDLSCPSCVAKIEKSLHGLEGVQRADVRFNTGRIEVEHDPQQAPPERLAEQVTKLGYEARISLF